MNSSFAGAAATPSSHGLPVVTARGGDVGVSEQVRDDREVCARFRAALTSARCKFLRAGVSSDSMKICHASLSTGLPPATSPSSTARLVATLALRPGRVARTLALTVFSANSALAQVGANYCWPAVANSTGAPAVISGSGSAVVHLNNLMLTSSGLPPNAAAFFLCSRTQSFVQNPGGSAGNICLGNPIGRLVGGAVVNSGATGVVNVTADLNMMPQPSGAVVVLPGETWNFMCWYRDTTVGGGATSNFSDGLAVFFGGVPTPVPVMVPIPAGTFLMGSNAPSGPPYYGGLEEQPVHQVTISYTFWVGQYEVTQSEFRSVMGVNPSFFPGSSRPVEGVSWNHALAYCAVLTALQSGNIPAGYEYRLPTEAEWEYACRAGTTTEFHYGSGLFCSQARFWYSSHSNSSCGVTSTSSTVSVGSYAPNAFGLYDMHGNLWEWCLDSYAPYTSAAVTDPFISGGPDRVCRGGGWGVGSSLCRSAFRSFGFAEDRYNDVGFRVVLAPVLVP